MTNKHEFHELSECPAQIAWNNYVTDDTPQCDSISGWSLIGKYYWYYFQTMTNKIEGRGAHRRPEYGIIPKGTVYRSKFGEGDVWIRACVTPGSGRYITGRLAKDGL